MLCSTTVLALVLNFTAPAAPKAPAIEVDRAGYVRSAHAVRVTEGEKELLVVDWRGAFPPSQARRTLVVEGLDAAGKVVFTREARAGAGMNDARFHRSFSARARVELPKLDAVVTLRVRAGR